MKAVVQFAPGGPETLSVGDVPMVQAPTGRKICIKVHASAVNRADCLQRSGGYAPPPGAPTTIGLEAAGVVESIGAEAVCFKPGDRVMALLPGGGYAEYALVDERHVMPIPEGFSFEQAAAIPEVWITAYQLLHYIGKAKAGETVLAHAAASGVGTALIQLAKYAQVQLLATVGSDDKAAYVEKLGAAATYNYKKNGIAFSAFVKEKTDSKGVNLILDPVSASYWQQNAESIATDGRWVLYGSMGGLSVEGPLFGYIMRKRITITGTTLRNRDDNYKADLVKAFASHSLPRFADKTFKPIIDRVFHMNDIVEAHRFVEANSNIGKVILTWDDRAASSI